MSTSADSFGFLRALLGRAESGPRPPAVDPEPGIIGERWTYLGALAPDRVLLGHDRVLDVPVRLWPLPVHDEQVSARARQLLRLAHPHIVRVHTLHARGELEVLVLDAVDGRTFVELADAGEVLSASHVATLGAELLDALAWVHGHGLVHGNLDGDALLLTRDGHVLVDGFALRVPTVTAQDELRATGTALLELAQATLGGGDSGATSSALLRVLRELAAGTYTRAADARDAMLRARRLAVDIQGGGRPVRPPPWADPARARREKKETTAVVLVDTPAAAAAAPAAAPPPSVIVLPTPAPEAPVIEALPEPEPPQPLCVAIPTPTPKAAPAPRPRPPAGMTWITHAEGEFLMDIDPVTNTAWKAYVDATGTTPPAHWYGTRIPAGKELHPVVGVSYYEARDYAAWRGVRLPTEAEWNLAAGAASNRRFPWVGPTCGADHCVCARVNSADTTPVGTHPASATPEGVRDLLGQVWEWVEGKDIDPTRTPVLGGSFKHPCKEPGRAPRAELAPASSYLYVGFRCAKDRP